MKYKVRCLNCRYDEENKMLVVLVFCEDFGEQRIFTIPQGDFHYKNPDVPAPAVEMIKMANMMEGKSFIWDIRDDPNRVSVPVDQQDQIAKVYKENLCNQLDEIREGLENTNRRTLTQLAEVVEKDRKQKDEHPMTEQDVLDEIMMRKRLRKMGFSGLN